MASRDRQASTSGVTINEIEIYSANVTELKSALGIRTVRLLSR